MADVYLNIDLGKKEDVVVFVSKSRSLCKVIYRDEKGSVTILRRLNAGRFAQILMEAGRTGRDDPHERETLGLFGWGNPPNSASGTPRGVSATSLIFLENSLGRKALSRVFCRPVQGPHEVLKKFLT